ncbi:Hypothetical protein, putative [Bodo saltans]|uniref:Uncharacterized protein n=1 Tax=Bodo saltans TaxID=75058 RepID=A0A0S4JCI0_BODSA|nr:Hypothetical protein, putative [Bodo saltans]|eukprot:CUG87715.1 Hypothetical protein, putative [Bodo saltans]
MPSFLPKFIAKRLGMTSSSSKKYSQDGAASADDAAPLEALMLLGGGLCAVSHQDAVSGLVAEFLGGVKVFVGCDGAGSVSGAVEDALVAEAAHLVNSPAAFDDTRSVATLRQEGGSGSFSNASSPASPSSPSTASGQSGTSRRLVVLYFPLLSAGHCGAVLEGLTQLPHIPIKVIGSLIFDGSSTAMEDTQMDVVSCRHRWMSRLHGSGNDKYATPLFVPMGCTVFDTYEFARAAVLLLDCIGQSSVTVVSDIPSGKPPKPGGGDVEELEVDESNNNSGGHSASLHRLKMCRTSALDALRIIAGNLQDNSDQERFRVLVTSSDRFRVTLGESPNAMQVLLNVGFRYNGTTSSGTSRVDAWGEGKETMPPTTTNDPTKLTLTVDIAAGAKYEIRRLVCDLDAEIIRRRAPPPPASTDIKPKKK